MTVAEFAKVWSCHYVGNTTIRYIYNNEITTLYKLRKINETLNDFRVEISLENLNENHLVFYSDDYDLDDLDLYNSPIFKSLKIDYPDNSFKYIITLIIT